MGKRHYFFITISLFIILVAYYIMNNHYQRWKTPFADQLDHYMKSNHQNNGIYNIPINNVVQFKWDKVIVYKFGCNPSELDKALGAEYPKNIDLTDGIIFVYHNKIVSDEQYPITTEKAPIIYIRESEYSNPYKNITVISSKTPYLQIQVNSDNNQTNYEVIP